MIAPLTRTATPEQVRAIWQNRYTAKDYDASRDVSKEDLDAILESAHLSASSMGMEPWHFLVLRRDTPLFDAVVAHCWGYHASPSHLVLLLGRDGQAFTTRSRTTSPTSTSTSRSVTRKSSTPATTRSSTSSAPTWG